jgi:hypothetical protein
VKRVPKRTVWLENRFREHLKEYPAAERAIENLAGKNHRSRAELISLLRGAYIPDRKRKIKGLLEKFVPSKDRAKKVAQSLESSAEQLRFLACSPIGANSLAAYQLAEVFFTSGPQACKETVMKPTDDATLNPRLLADTMDRQAQILRRWADSPLIAATSRGFTFRKLWKHLPIALIANTLPRKNGKVPWVELALALEAVSAGYGLQADVSSDALRKQYERFEKTFTGNASERSALIRDLLAAFLPSRTS